MIAENDPEIEAVLEAYDHYHEEHEDEARRDEDAGAHYDARFREVIATVVRPYFDEVAQQLQAHGHAALIEEGSVSSPDPRLAGGSKITLAFLPKERAEQSLHHQLELNDAPHFMMRCDKRRRAIELYQDPDPGFLGGGPSAGVNWQIEDVTQENLRKRVRPMIEEALNPPRPMDVSYFGPVPLGGSGPHRTDARAGAGSPSPAAT